MCIDKDELARLHRSMYRNPTRQEQTAWTGEPLYAPPDYDPRWLRKVSGSIEDDWIDVPFWLAAAFVAFFSAVPFAFLIGTMEGIGGWGLVHDIWVYVFAAWLLVSLVLTAGMRRKHYGRWK